MKSVLLSLTLLLFSFGALAGEHYIPEDLQQVEHIHHPTSEHFTAGQPTEQEMGYFAEHGVRHVVNLRPPQEAPEVNGAAWASQHAMAYYHIPIAGGEDLTQEHVAVFDKIMQRIGDEKALLHCGSSNRVGAMVALRGVWHQGMSEEEALQLGREYGMTSLEEHVLKQLHH
ncbi:hypothetical protein CWE09_09595 [Aliidiomarina minuta]|uniref:DSP-PTPase phosphatase fused to NAD+ Kinase domain-containing protein n=1 Tax=Aliidiomarina minuta TaxID=880057 RepID=A0A432W9U7_9GAMM|nr:sulfur transferase domain-containing protein [Aliidiomarina minuta]RUO26923.1 hypothetical protein CWE09_09595 [Aliidiomarina minuta]